MSSLLVHREKVIRLASEAIETDESVYDPLYIDSLIHDARANVLRLDFIKFRRWHPLAIQKFYPAFDVEYQDSVCYTKFKLPTTFIQANSMQDGFVYAGPDSIDKARNFRRIKSRSELADFLKSQTMTPATGRYIGILTEGQDVIVVSKNSIRTILIEGVFADPTAFDTYNIEKDEYPISVDLAELMYEFIQAKTFRVTDSKVPDTISSSSTPPQSFAFPKK